VVSHKRAKSGLYNYIDTFIGACAYEWANKLLCTEALEIRYTVLRSAGKNYIIDLVTISHFGFHMCPWQNKMLTNHIWNHCLDITYIVPAILIWCDIFPSLMSIPIFRDAFIISDVRSATLRSALLFDSAAMSGVNPRRRLLADSRANLQNCTGEWNRQRAKNNKQMSCEPWAKVAICIFMEMQDAGCETRIIDLRVWCRVNAQRETIIWYIINFKPLVDKKTSKRI